MYNDSKLTECSGSEAVTQRGFEGQNSFGLPVGERMSQLLCGAPTLEGTRFVVVCGGGLSGPDIAFFSEALEPAQQLF